MCYESKMSKCSSISKRDYNEKKMLINKFIIFDPR